MKHLYKPCLHYHLGSSKFGLSQTHADLAQAKLGNNRLGPPHMAFAHMCSHCHLVSTRMVSFAQTSTITTIPYLMSRQVPLLAITFTTRSVEHIDDVCVANIWLKSNIALCLALNSECALA